MCVGVCDVCLCAGPPPIVPPISNGPSGSSRSDSPYVDDDDSFADFLAREVHESALDSSPSPPLTGPHSSTQGLCRFGVTASCPPAPVLLPEGSLNAVSQ